MRLFKKAALIYALIFLVLFAGSFIHIQLGSRKALLDVQDESGNWIVAWDEGGPDVVPRDMDEAISKLTDELPEEAVARYRHLISKSPEELTRDEAMELHGEFGHLGMGMSIRNAWGLWHGSRLARWLGWRVGWHPDNMSSEISRQFENFLSGKELSNLYGKRFLTLALITTIIMIPLSLLLSIVRLTQITIKRISRKSVDTTPASAPR